LQPYCCSTNRRVGTTTPTIRRQGKASSVCFLGRNKTRFFSDSDEAGSTGNAGLANRGNSRTGIETYFRPEPIRISRDGDSCCTRATGLVSATRNPRPR
jgi:hypothetical protein